MRNTSHTGAVSARVTGRAVTGVLLAAAIAAAGTGTANADTSSATDTSVTAADTLAALQSTPGVLAASDTVTSTSDADTASSSTVGGTVVDIPRNPADGVSMASPGSPAITIDLPTSGPATAVPVAPGTAAFPGTDGSATAMQATENGGVRMLTVIDNPAAPEDYSYGVTVPGGGHIEVNPDGTASVLDATNTAVSIVQAPWATDANGAAVPTTFTTDGQTLTQHISHHSTAAAYPIKADPWFWSYLGCITGIGVPIAAGIILSSVGTLTALRAIIAGRKIVPAGSPFYKAMAWYATSVSNSCRAFLRS